MRNIFIYCLVVSGVKNHQKIIEFSTFQKLEGRVASDEDLKLSDLLRYYMRDTDAAKALLYRRAKCLSEFDNANKALDKARAKNKDIPSVSCITVKTGDSDGDGDGGG